MNNRYKGIIYIILSAFCFAFMNMFVRLAGDLPSVQKSFFRNFVAAGFAFVILLKDRVPFRCKRENLIYLLLRAGFGTMGILCNFYAIDHLVLADASMLNKMSPFFAVLFSFLVLKEKVTASQALIVAGAFAGSMFVVKPTFANMDLIPSIIGLLGGICAGAAYTMVRKLGENGEKGSFIVFFFSLFSCTVTLPWLIFDYHPMTAAQLAALLMAGFSAAGGQFSITAAYTCAPAREISVYDYSQIIFAALLGFAVFGQIPDVLSWLGYGIICTMAVIMFLYNTRHEHKKKELRS
ncbi:DMT family transporter [Lachnospiraceae bacterium MD308]|nr:DMT family transporter [Lachnospiraceae bacterium MD308]